MVGNGRRFRNGIRTVYGVVMLSKASDRKGNLSLKNGFAAGKQDGSKNLAADRASNKSFDQKFDAGTADAVKDQAAGRASNKAIKNCFCCE